MGAGLGLFVCLLACPLVQVGRLFRCYFADVSKIVLTLLLFGAFPAFWSLCSWCIACEYGSISRFKGVFSAFYGVCVGLFVLGGLRGLCGLCTRVELGGLKG